jgi:putative transposase
MASRRHVVNLLAALLTAGVEVSAAGFAREHGVPVRTVYRKIKQFEVEGHCRPRSRRPHRSPWATPPDLVAWILKLRADLRPDNGADYIRDALRRVHAQTGASWRVPSRSTINRVLDRDGVLVRNPKKRPRSSYRRFSFAQPRDCYQIDATELVLADGTKVVAFEVLDDCTRKLVACHAAAAETAQGAIAAITKAVNACGAPALVLSDNGTAFTSRFIQPTAGPSRFTRVVNGFGSRLIHSTPYHPQTCGKVERHHQTLKRWLATQPTPATRPALQRLLNRYRDYYNTQRGHSALPGRATPQHAWDNARSHGGPSNLPIQTDATVRHCVVHNTGVITIGSHRIGVGCTHHGTTLTAIRDRDTVTVYTANGQPLGHAHLDPTKLYQPLTKINAA